MVIDQLSGGGGAKGLKENPKEGRKEGRDIRGWWFCESPRLHSMVQPTTSAVQLYGQQWEG